MESQPGMARYGNSQSNLESVILKSTLYKVFTQFMKIDFPEYDKTTVFQKSPFNYFKTTMLYRDYLSFCHHLDEKTYSVTRGTDQEQEGFRGQDGYVSMATLLNSQSEVSSWSSQEVNVSQPQGQCEICQGQ